MNENDSLKSKSFFYASCFLSSISALISILPLCYVSDITASIIFTEGTEYISGYAWRAVIYSVISIALYIAGLLCSKTAASKIYSLSLSAGLVVLLFWSDWRLALVSLAPLTLGFVIMAMSMKAGYRNDERVPVVCYTAAINSSFLFLIAAGIGIARSGVSEEFMKSFILAVIAAPLISLRPARTNRRTNENANGKFNLAVGSLSCALHNITLILPAVLMYSFLMYMILLCGTGYSIQHNSSVFYLSTGFVCAFLILFSSWLQYSIAYQSRRLSALTGSIISTCIIAAILIFIDWRMALSVLWVIPVSFMLSSNIVLRPGIASAALTASFLYANDSLSAGIFILFVLAALRLYDTIVFE